MSNNPNLEDELADFTDRLFSGDVSDVSADNMIEARLVRQLHNIVTKNPQPTAAFRTQLTHRLNDEWKAVNKQPVRQPISFRFNPVMAAAAAIITVLLFVMLLMNPTFVGSPGMAGNGQILIPAIFIAVLLIGAAVFFWRNKR